MPPAAPGSDQAPATLGQYYEKLQALEQENTDLRMQLFQARFAREQEMRERVAGGSTLRGFDETSIVAMLREELDRNGKALADKEEIILQLQAKLDETSLLGSSINRFMMGTEDAYDHALRTERIPNLSTTKVKRIRENNEVLRKEIIAVREKLLRYQEANKLLVLELQCKQGQYKLVVHERNKIQKKYNDLLSEIKSNENIGLTRTKILEAMEEKVKEKDDYISKLKEEISSLKTELANQRGVVDGYELIKHQLSSELLNKDLGERIVDLVQGLLAQLQQMRSFMMQYENENKTLRKQISVSTSITKHSSQIDKSSRPPSSDSVGASIRELANTSKGIISSINESRGSIRKEQQPSERERQNIEKASQIDKRSPSRHRDTNRSKTSSHVKQSGSEYVLHNNDKTQQSRTQFPSIYSVKDGQLQEMSNTEFNFLLNSTQKGTNIKNIVEGPQQFTISPSIPTIPKYPAVMNSGDDTSRIPNINANSYTNRFADTNTKKSITRTTQEKTSAESITNENTRPAITSRLVNASSGKDPLTMSEISTPNNPGSKATTTTTATTTTRIEEEEKKIQAREAVPTITNMNNPGDNRATNNITGHTNASNYNNTNIRGTDIDFTKILGMSTERAFNPQTGLTSSPLQNTLGQDTLSILRRLDEQDNENI